MFIQKSDYSSKIRELRFDQMTESNQLVWEQASNDAVALVRNYLFKLYDTAAIFSQTGTNRDTFVLLHCKTIALYFLHERLPQAMIPQHVETRYESSIKMLDDISKGKIDVDLPPRKEDTNGDGVLDGNVTNFAWGSRPARSH